MLVVAETTVDEHMSDLVISEILEGVGPVQCVTWTHSGIRRGRVGGKKENSGLANPSCLGHGIGIRGSRGICVRNVSVKFNRIFILPLLFSIRNHGGGAQVESRTGWGWEVESSVRQRNVGRNQLQRSSLRRGARCS